LRLVGATDIYTGTPDTTATGTNRWNGALHPTLGQGTAVGQPKILFGKIEDDVVEQQIAKMGTTGQTPAPPDDTITIDDFRKVQLRTARVIAAERVPKSEKLLKLRVELGGEERQILAGIAKFYSPEEMIGKTVVVVANLKPAKLMGMESQGMLLAANDAEGNLALVTPERPAPSGAEVR